MIEPPPPSDRNRDLVEGKASEWQSAPMSKAAARRSASSSSLTLSPGRPGSRSIGSSASPGRPVSPLPALPALPPRTHGSFHWSFPLHLDQSIASVSASSSSSSSALVASYELLTKSSKSAWAAWVAVSAAAATATGAAAAAATRLESSGKRKQQQQQLSDHEQEGSPLIHVLQQMFSGLAHLHSLNIVHRDLKPQNVLLAPDHSGKIADMGLGKKLDEHRSSFDSHIAGSVGWQAPELLTEGPARLTKAVDAFSAGCIVHYVLTGGLHPFGESVERELNIVRGRYSTDAVAGCPELRDLVESLIENDPAQRLTALEALQHPFFWSDDKKLAFLQDASDRLEGEGSDSPVNVALESRAAHVVGGDWPSLLDAGLRDNLGKYRKYDPSSVRDCLRVIRNKKNHYRDLPASVQAVVGPLPTGFLHYFTARFPSLLMHMYHVMALAVTLERESPSPAATAADAQTVSTPTPTPLRAYFQHVTVQRLRMLAARARSRSWWVTSEDWWRSSS